MKCSICSHINRKQIDRDYILGKSKNKISKEYKVGYTSLTSHINKHLTADIIEDKKCNIKDFVMDNEVTKHSPSLENLSECVEYIHKETMDIYHKSKNECNYDMCLKALKQELSTLELIIKTKELMFSYNRQENWERTLSKILKVLSKYKDARLAVSAELYYELGGNSLTKNKMED